MCSDLRVYLLLLINTTHFQLFGHQSNNKVVVESTVSDIQHNNTR